MPEGAVHGEQPVGLRPQARSGRGPANYHDSVAGGCSTAQATIQAVSGQASPCRREIVSGRKGCHARALQIAGCATQGRERDSTERSRSQRNCLWYPLPETKQRARRNNNTSGCSTAGQESRRSGLRSCLQGPSTRSGGQRAQERDEVRRRVGVFPERLHTQRAEGQTAKAGRPSNRRTLEVRREEGAVSRS